MLFCTGSTGILGAIGEGVNGDSTVLLTKSVYGHFSQHLLLLLIWVL